MGKPKRIATFITMMTMIKKFVKILLLTDIDQGMRKQVHPVSSWCKFTLLQPFQSQFDNIKFQMPRPSNSTLINYLIGIYTSVYSHILFCPILFIIMKGQKQSKGPCIRNWSYKIVIYTYICTYMYKNILQVELYMLFYNDLQNILLRRLISHCILLRHC